jgi:phosphonate transport system substrate-binding protein
MNFNFPISKKRSLFQSFLVASILVFAPGCDSNRDTTIVDFSKTLPPAQPGGNAPDNNSLRVAVAAMISPKETFVYYRQVLDYIGGQLDKDIQLIQRKTYSEINELFSKGQVDLGFICSGPYATGKEKYGFKLLATPQVQGSHFYHAYLIVNKDSPFHLLEDLRGREFAFTDAESNTGRLVPIYWLARMQERPETFFGKTINTYSHDNSILAVSRGLVDGASVDGLVWEYYHRKDPIFTSRTRIIKKSEPYGIPPLVSSKYLPDELKERIRKLLFSMHLDPAGQAILEELLIDRFIEPRDEWYDGIRRMEKELTLLDEVPYALEKP